jgi:hypothetical protein
VLADIVTRLNSNLARVDNLIILYGPNPGHQGRRPVHQSDILRAALVLLHSSMEDFLRSLLIWRVPTVGTKGQLDSYPLPDSQRKQPRAFLLGSLVAHKAVTVAALIERSVREYLEQYGSFNNLGEVKQALEQIGIPHAAVVGHNYGGLPALISRRHNIVHKADRNEALGGQGNHRTSSISAVQLSDYLAAVRSLRDFVVAQLP